MDQDWRVLEDEIEWIAVPLGLSAGMWSAVTGIADRPTGLARVKLALFG